MHRFRNPRQTHNSVRTHSHAVAPNHNSAVTSHVSNCPRRGVRLLCRTKAELIIPQKTVVKWLEIAWAAFPCRKPLLTHFLYMCINIYSFFLLPVLAYCACDWHFGWRRLMRDPLCLITIWYTSITKLRSLCGVCHSGAPPALCASSRLPSSL